MQARIPACGVGHRLPVSVQLPHTRRGAALSMPPAPPTSLIDLAAHQFPTTGGCTQPARSLVAPRTVPAQIRVALLCRAAAPEAGWSSEESDALWGGVSRALIKLGKAGPSESHGR